MKKNSVEKRPVSVILQKQLILPLCTEVVESFNKDGNAYIELIKSNAFTNDQSKPWLDSILFKESIHSLLDEAIRNKDERETVKFSLYSGGASTWQVDISYLLCKSSNERFTDKSGYPYFVSVRTREIISQHRAKMSFEKKNQKVTIQISYEK